MKELLPVLVTELFMTVVLSYIILYFYDRRELATFRQRSVVTLVLAMMGSMLNTLAYYLITNRDFLNTVISLNISMGVMSGTLITLLWLSSTDRASRPLTGRSTLVFAALLLYNEISMGVLVYTLAFGYTSASGINGGLPSFVELLSLGINSYLFIAPMLAEMLAVFLLRPSAGTHRIVLLTLILLAAFSPTIAGNDSFTQPGAFLVVLAMVVFIPALFRPIMREAAEYGHSGYNPLVWVFPVFVFTMAGVLFGIFYSGTFASSWVLYGTGMVSGMLFYFVYSLAPSGPQNHAGISSGN